MILFFKWFISLRDKYLCLSIKDKILVSLDQQKTTIIQYVTCWHRLCNVSFTENKIEQERLIKDETKKFGSYRWIHYVFSLELLSLCFSSHTLSGIDHGHRQTDPKAYRTGATI